MRNAPRSSLARVTADVSATESDSTVGTAPRHDANRCWGTDSSPSAPHRNRRGTSCPPTCTLTSTQSSSSARGSSVKRHVAIPGSSKAAAENSISFVGPTHCRRRPATCDRPCSGSAPVTRLDPPSPRTDRRSRRRRRVRRRQDAGRSHSCARPPVPASHRQCFDDGARPDQRQLARARARHG